MPTYEYACRSCGEHLEVVQAFTDAALTKCPKCDGSLRKVFGNVGISFKGDGFYKTDSRKTSSSSTRSERSGEKAEGGSKVAAGNGSGGDATPSAPAEKSKTTDDAASKPATKPKSSTATPSGS